MKIFRTVPKVILTLGILAAIFRPLPSLSRSHPMVEPLPPTGDSQVAPLEVPGAGEPRLSREQLISLLRQHVQYVFILYQENRSFDSYFGTFPGVDGLYSQPENQTPGFSQPVENTDGKMEQMKPFRLGPKEFAADLDDVGGDHSIIIKKMHLVGGKPRMDLYALAEEEKHARGGHPTLQDKQLGELTMAHVDGDTIPFLWRWANRFVIFDHIFELITSHSTPGNLSIIAAQSGQTQAALHPEEIFKDSGEKAPGEPILNDGDPLWGSPEDTKSNPKMSVNPKDFRKKGQAVQTNQTYATLMLSLAGSEAQTQTSDDPEKETDLADIEEDVAYLSRQKQQAVPWGWFQEGYGEPMIPGVDYSGEEAALVPYSTHHNAPQYFGYIVHSPAMRDHIHNLRDFFTAVQKETLPEKGGVFYVKGGYGNIMGLKTGDPDPAVQKKFVGDDDHPGHGESQISEALLAKAVNAIAKSRYWSRCAIVITWDDTGGIYDHVPPPIRVMGPDHKPLSDGPRLPFLLISPYARAHAVVHETGDQGSAVKFVDEVFGLTPLAKLPDELKGRKIGKKKWGQENWGPDDALTPGVCDLVTAFDPARLSGNVPPLPSDYAVIPDILVEKLPQISGYGCKDIGIVPVDQKLGLPNPIPDGFNPRPTTDSSNKTKKIKGDEKNEK